MDGIILLLVVGAVAGWLGSIIYKGGSLGFLGNLIIGIIGAIVGDWSFAQLGINKIGGNALVSNIIIATVGAIIVLFLINFATKKKK